MAVLQKVQESEFYKSIKSQHSRDTSPSNDKYTRSTSFVVSTISELKKVQWPNLKHVFQWSLVVIIFCTLFGGLLGYADTFFSSTVVVADCVTKVNKKQTNDSISDCTRSYVRSLTLQQ